MQSESREAKRYVITGGPGVGKTTLLDALKNSGFVLIPEDARRIIKEQMQINGEGLPWKNKTLYSDLMFEASLKAYRQVSKEAAEQTVFFDRGILDAVCYRNMENLPVSKAWNRLINKHLYNKKIFILPPWEEIYETDDERKQTWEEAVYTFEKMKHTYSEYGYDVFLVPKNTVDKRCEFILDHIRQVTYSEGSF